MPMTLREARQRKGWTQVELAQRAGVTQVHISSIELGKVAAPSWETVSRLSKALGVKPETLFPVSEKPAVA